MKVVTNSAEETMALGVKLAGYLGAGDILGLTGGLGAGKTTFVKGIARGLGVKEMVSSPSFVLIKEYAGKPPLYHFDLYRMDKLEDMEYLGMEEYLFEQGICVIEWADKMRMLLPDYLRVQLDIIGENKRQFNFFAQGRHYEDIVRRYFQ